MLVVTSINGKLIIQLEWPNPNTKEIRCTGITSGITVKAAACGNAKLLS